MPSRDWFAFARAQVAPELRATRATTPRKPQEPALAGVARPVARAGDSRATRATTKGEARTREAPVAHVAHVSPTGTAPQATTGSQENQGVPASVARVAQVAHENGASLQTMGATGAPAAADFDERAALAEYEAGVPREWAEGFARLQVMAPPPGIRPARWQQVIDDAGRFIDRWAATAARLGWDTASVFAVHPEKPEARVDMAGLVWLIDGSEVVAISADTAKLRHKRGAVLSYYRRPRGEPLVMVWELADTTGKAR